MQISEHALDQLDEVIRECACAKMPTPFLKGILSDYPELIHECESGGIWDTCQRSVAMNAVAFQLCGKFWPTYGDGQDYKERFIKEFDAAVIETGGVLED